MFFGLAFLEFNTLQLRVRCLCWSCIVRWCVQSLWWSSTLNRRMYLFCCSTLQPHVRSFFGVSHCTDACVLCVGVVLYTCTILFIVLECLLLLLLFCQLENFTLICAYEGFQEFEIFLENLKTYAALQVFFLVSRMIISLPIHNLPLCLKLSKMILKGMTGMSFLCFLLNFLNLLKCDMCWRWVQEKCDMCWRWVQEKCDLC